MTQLFDLWCPPSTARLARVVVPGHPRHITQRDNRRRQTCFCADDYDAYLDPST